MTTLTTTAYLARIQLNPFSRTVQRDLRDAVRLHRTLMNLVPDELGDSPRNKAGLLFRLDETPQVSTLLVQATTPLDAAALPDGYGRVEVKDLTPMFRALTPGMRVRYRIAANPAKRERLSSEDKEKGKKLGSIRPLTGSDADQWWIRRASAAGLEIHTLLPTPLRSLVSREHGTHGMRHQLIRYDGTATITDTKTLTEALRAGIGRGKPYGAGLLSLAPAGAA